MCLNIKSVYYYIHKWYIKHIIVGYDEIQDRIDIKNGIEYVAQDLFPDRPGFQGINSQDRLILNCPGPQD